MGEHLSSSDEVHDKEHFFLGLEGILQLNQEGMHGFFQQEPFRSSFAEMLLLNKILLPHTLDRIIFRILLILAKHDLSKSSPSQHLK